MRWLLFLSRLAFISGVFFLASASLLVTDWLKDENLKSTVIIIGYFMGIILFPVVNLCYIAVFLVKKSRPVNSARSTATSLRSAKR